MPRSMSRLARILCPFLLLGAASPPPPDTETPGPPFFTALRVADLRLATIAYRLTTANVALCDQVQPQFGMPIHALTQYGAAARPGAMRVFGFETVVAVEAVVPGGPAARAGVQAGDSIAAINGRTQPMLPASPQDDPRARDTADALLASGAAAAPVALSVLRGGRRVAFRVTPVPGCRSRFEILLGSGLDAGADGALVQIGERFFENYDDPEIAVIVAHELAHNILRHRVRLDAAKVSRGMLAEFGRNGRLIRQTEDDADRLGIYLLANAGYDPMAAPAFWRSKGGDIDGGLFRSRTHASSKARADALEALAKQIAEIPKRPIIPDILGTCNVPLR